MLKFMRLVSHPFHLVQSLTKLFYTLGALSLAAALILSTGVLPAAASGSSAPSQQERFFCDLSAYSGERIKVEDQTSPWVFSVTPPQYFSVVGIKAATECAQIFTADGTSTCYRVSGIGTSTVTVWDLADAPASCREISHLEIVAVDPAPTSTPEDPTSTPEDPTSTPEDPTSTPVTPTSTPEDPTSTPVTPTSTPEDPTSTPVTPTSTPEDPTSTPEDPDQHAGGPDQHAGGPDQHAGGPDQHAGDPNQHAGESDQHAGGPDQHAGGSDQHAGESDQHAGESDQHAGRSHQHARSPQ